MLLLASAARSFFAIAMLAFGIQHLVYGEFVTRLVPKLPAWIPYRPWWAYLTGGSLSPPVPQFSSGKQHAPQPPC